MRVTFVVNGSLLGRDAATISLDAFADKLAHVTIIGSVHLTGTTSQVDLDNVSIGGTLFVTDSTAKIVLFKNHVGGSVLVRDNKNSGSDIVIEDNTIGGSLVCSGNMPAPLPITDPNFLNTVGGNGVGQCSGLVQH
jgi:hypothetical protein